MFVIINPLKKTFNFFFFFGTGAQIEPRAFALTYIPSSFLFFILK